MTGLITKLTRDSKKRAIYTLVTQMRSGFIAIGLMTGFLGSLASAQENDLNPAIPAQFDQDAFTKELNSGTETGRDSGSSRNETSAQITVDSYGSRRFVDIVEITPANGPQYFLLDDGNGTPNLGGARNEGDLSERRNISKWRLGKW